MTDIPEREPSFRAESPQIELECNGIQITISWDNTLMRQFDEGDGMYDHVCHKLPDGGYVAFIPREELKERLTNERFPVRRDPVVDEPTLIWYANVIANELDSL